VISLGRYLDAHQILHERDSGWLRHETPRSAKGSWLTVAGSAELLSVQSNTSIAHPLHAANFMGHWPAGVTAWPYVAVLLLLQGGCIAEVTQARAEGTSKPSPVGSSHFGIPESCRPK
jgi:hypothetical protein